MKCKGNVKILERVLLVGILVSAVEFGISAMLGFLVDKEVMPLRFGCNAAIVLQVIIMFGACYYTASVALRQKLMVSLGVLLVLVIIHFLIIFLLFGDRAFALNYVAGLELIVSVIAGVLASRQKAAKR